MTKRLVALLALTSALSLGLSAQKTEKSWTEWSKKDAEKVLNDSPWGQTQIETDTSEMFFRPQDSQTAAATNPNPRNDRGQLNQATNVKYHIRLFSARPIRQAYARMILLSQGDVGAEFKERMRLFAEVPSNEMVVVAVAFESKDQRFSGVAMQAFNSTTTAVLKNNTYLEVKGKRVFLGQYEPPGKEGFGALFIFPRVVDGAPFITPDAGEVRFVSEVSKNVKLNMRFKVSAMTYDGKLEY